MRLKIEENFRKREEAKICPIVRSGKSEISNLCPYKDISAKKCRSHAHFGCATYKKLKSDGLI